MIKYWLVCVWSQCTLNKRKVILDELTWYYGIFFLHDKISRRTCGKIIYLIDQFFVGQGIPVEHVGRRRMCIFGGNRNTTTGCWRALDVHSATAATAAAFVAARHGRWWRKMVHWHHGHDHIIIVGVLLLLLLLLLLQLASLQVTLLFLFLLFRTIQWWQRICRVKVWTRRCRARMCGRCRCSKMHDIGKRSPAVWRVSSNFGVI